MLAAAVVAAALTKDSAPRLQERANAARELAVHFCVTPGEFGLSVSGSGNVSGALRIPEWAKRLIPADAKASVIVQSEAYYGVTREELAGAIKDANGCRIKALGIFRDMLTPKRAPYAVTSKRKHSSVLNLAASQSSSDSLAINTSEPPQLLTVHGLFKSDYSQFGKIGASYDVRRATVGPHLLIEYDIVEDFDANASFMMMYVPPSEDTYVALEGLQSFVAATVAKAPYNVSETWTQPNGEMVNNKELKFTGRVYVYYSSDLSIPQQGALISQYSKADLILILRGQSYASTEYLRQQVANNMSIAHKH